MSTIIIITIIICQYSKCVEIVLSLEFGKQQVIPLAVSMCAVDRGGANSSRRVSAPLKSSQTSALRQPVLRRHPTQGHHAGDSDSLSECPRAGPADMALQMLLTQQCQHRPPRSQTGS